MSLTKYKFSHFYCLAQFFHCSFDFEDRQKYYSDDKALFESSGAMSQLLHEEVSFFPSEDQIVVETTTTDADTTTTDNDSISTDDKTDRNVTS